MRRISIFILLICFACNKDDKQRIIADLQDRRQTDSLLIYLPYSALAFASVQDTVAIDALGKIKSPEATFALGQMYHRKAVPPLLSRKNAFEALGKVITEKEELGHFLVDTDDSSALADIAWGLYRAGVRGVVDSTSVDKELSILNNRSAGRTARLGAAHFFSRVQFGKDRKVGQALVAASNDPDPEVRMALVNALAKVAPDLAIDGVSAAVEDADYRVRVSSARALRTQSFDNIKHLFEKLLNDPDAHVNVAAAEVLLIIAADTASIHQWARSSKNWRAQATLYSKLVGLDKEVKAIYVTSNNDYQRAALLNAISDPKFIFDQYKSNEAKIIKSTAASRLAEISSDLDTFKQIIADGDQGSLIPICGALQDSTRGFKKTITDYAFLENAKDKLSLPRDYETYVPLEQALNYLKGLPPPVPLKNEYNHPIDWKLAATILKDQQVLIQTSKGEIVMQLFIDEAPGSVVNFVSLVKSKYFDGRFFHRVVPNFVIQTGCSRGDGFGSEDYSIRSEFSQRRYKAGSVGMASAGKDTEGTQWFITHSPAPHLDGKYTIFAEVVKGMDVVHKIEVGDKIIEAHLID